MAKGVTQEDFSRKPEVTVGSDRSFGLAFAALFALVGLVPLRHGQGLRLWALALSVSFAAAALLAPRLLHSLNLLWFRLGLILHRVAMPVVMGLLFFGGVTPVGAKSGSEYG